MENLTNLLEKDFMRFVWRCYCDDIGKFARLIFDKQAWPKIPFSDIYMPIRRYFLGELGFFD